MLSGIMDDDVKVKVDVDVDAAVEGHLHADVDVNVKVDVDVDGNWDGAAGYKRSPLLQWQKCTSQNHHLV